jgi:hypothetical protein
VRAALRLDGDREAAGRTADFEREDREPARRAFSDVLRQRLAAARTVALEQLAGAELAAGHAAHEPLRLHRGGGLCVRRAHVDRELDRADGASASRDQPAAADARARRIRVDRAGDARGGQRLGELAALARLVAPEHDRVSERRRPAGSVVARDRRRSGAVRHLERHAAIRTLDDVRNELVSAARAGLEHRAPWIGPA